MALGPHDGVLLVAHGTVTDLDDLPEFVAEIRHGRPAPPGLLEELRRRYQTIGGSPLLEITKAQAAALARELDAPVLVAMRLWHPRVEEVLCGITGLRLRRLCLLPLAPFSVHVYWAAAQASLEKARAELGDATPELVPAEPWGHEPSFIDAHVGRIRTSLAGANGAPTALVLTAHSLPTRAISAGDPYQSEFSRAAQAIGRALDRPYRIAYQSQGADGGDWLGPDLKSMLEAVKAEGLTRVVVAPVGFPAEHVETLYDLDVEAAGWARALGLELVRVPALDADPGLVSALGNVARRALG
jgi:protoporphyrin/coproporphyrin ferrochelatase